MVVMNKEGGIVFVVIGLDFLFFVFLFLGKLVLFGVDGIFFGCFFGCKEKLFDFVEWIVMDVVEYFIEVGFLE